MSSPLQDTFIAFAGFGSRQYVADMDSAKFAKLCKDAGLIGRGFTVTDADLIFTKVKAKGNRRINFGEFQLALQHVANRKNMSLESVEAAVVAASPGMNNATQAEFVKFHDDKSTYTGVYAKGGPTNVDKVKASGLAGLLDRSPADVRGVKKF